MSKIESNQAVGVITPGGRGAVATVAVIGKHFDKVDSFFTAANGRVLQEQEVNRIVFGQWGHDPPEDVVVCRTEMDRVEVSCHGGDAATRRILDDLRSVGIESVSASQLQERTQTRFEVEWQSAVMRATTTRTLGILLKQRIAFPRAIRSIRDQYLGGEVDAAKESLSQLISWARFGRHLTEPWDVVLCGRPNAGKSSLINALLGFQRSIVFDQPGTTRDIVRGETAIDGWPIRLADTAGIRNASETLESAGIERARRLLADADLCIVVCDVSEPPDADTDQLLREIPNALRVAHKADLPIQWPKDRLVDMLRVSSTTKLGLPELIQEISRRIVPDQPSEDLAVPFTQMQIETLERSLNADPKLAATVLTALIDADSGIVGSPG